MPSITTNKEALTTERAKRRNRLSEGRRISTIDYSLSYDGKMPEACIFGAPVDPPRKLFSVNNVNKINWHNRIYYGDNFGILRSLCEDREVCGKVTLIYIDPPFSTGAAFANRNSDDAYEDDLSGAKFLESLRQRLILLRELLAENGSIYVHLDGKMAFPIKVVMDEIYGPSNFRNWICRKKSNSKNFTRNQYGNISDYIMFYSKTDKYVWNRPYEKWTEDKTKKEYPCFEDGTGRRYKKVPVHAPGIRNGETGKLWKGKMPPPGKHWQFTPDKLDEFDQKNEIYWSPTGNPRRKVFFDDSNGIPIQDIWLDCKDAHNQNIKSTGYPTEKSYGLLDRIVKASSNPCDLVLDCYMGSGTTLVAAEDNRRKWIGIDSGPTAIKTVLFRLANGSEPMGDYVNKTEINQKKLFMHSHLVSNLSVFADAGNIPSTATKESWHALFSKNLVSISL